MQKKAMFAISGFIICLIVVGYLIPERLVIPVQNANTTDWNHSTYWYQPWGASGVHKGIDIFATKGTPLLSATTGVVLYRGVLRRGGKVLLVLGSKWRLHYYAHMDSISAEVGDFVSISEKMGTVGTSGNAQGKPAHVHYSVITLLPYLWRWDMSTQGWKKIFYLNPSRMLLERNT